MKKKITFITLGVIGIGLIINTFFNRNPKRNIPTDGNIVSPADGVIQSIENNRIEIFIRLTDIHIQRMPCECTILNIKNLNNYNDFFTIYTKFGDILIERKGGILARSLRTFAKEGDRLEKGQPFGRILLGSHTWITLPESFDTLKVKVGDTLKAGETIIA